MDTKQKYIDSEVGIVLTENSAQERIEADHVPDDTSYNVPDRGLGGHHTKEFRRGYGEGSQDVEVDGWAVFYWPDRKLSEPHMAYSFPFRTGSDGPWFGNPDAEKWSKRPVWEWKNPEMPLSEITLEPSLGINGEHGVVFHCFLKNGGIEWL